jgi:hypothetical protein
MPLHLAEMLEGIVTIISGNWLVGWWKDRTESLEQRFVNAVNVFLDGCAPARREAARPIRANHVTRAKRANRKSRRGRNSRSAGPLP